MTPNRTKLMVLKGVISEMPQDVQFKIQAHAAELRVSLKSDPVVFGAAMAMVMGEAAFADESPLA